MIPVDPRKHETCKHCSRAKCGVTILCRWAYQDRLKKKKSKYGNKRAEGSGKDAGRSFMSQGERSCSEYFRALEAAGEIRDLEFQVHVYLSAARIHFILDFKYFDVRDQEVIYADYKGGEFQRWSDFKKLWKHYGLGKLRVFKGYGDNITITEEIVPKQREEIT